MAPATYFLLVSFLALVTSQAIASDPSPLQDFCVADIHSPGIHALTLNNALCLVVLNHISNWNYLSEQKQEFYVCPNYNDF